MGTQGASTHPTQGHSDNDSAGAGMRRLGAHLAGGLLGDLQSARQRTTRKQPQRRKGRQGATPTAEELRARASAFNTLMAADDRTGSRHPLYTVVPALLDHIRDGLDDPNSREYGARFKAMREAPILILDDLGAERRSEWTEELLFKLLDCRYRQALPTAVASNLIPADLEPGIASRLQDRGLSTALLMAGPDYRLSGQRSSQRSSQRAARRSTRASGKGGA